MVVMVVIVTDSEDYDSFVTNNKNYCITSCFIVDSVTDSEDYCS
jgi:hypothetical protein